MKPLRLVPGWGIFFGIFIAPIVCTVNALLAHRLWGDARIIDPKSVWFTSLLICTPMGFISSRVLEIWNHGDYGRSRSLAMFFGIFCFICCLWTGHSVGRVISEINSGDAAFIGALVLPVVWSLLFPLFAIFARPPKK